MYWLALGFIGAGLLQAYAQLTSAGAMRTWSSQNVMQTGIISGDREQQLIFDRTELDYKRDHLDYMERELNYKIHNNAIRSQQELSSYTIQIERLKQDIAEHEYYVKQHEIDYQRQLAYNQATFERDISKMATLEGFDRLNRRFQGSMELSRQTHDVEIYNAKQRQLVADSENYVLNYAMQTNINDNSFGESEPMPQVAFILSKLLELKHGKQPSIPDFHIIPADESTPLSPQFTNALLIGEE